MFKWLADMLVRTPVQGSCACCEGKKQQLQKMQRAIINNDENLAPEQPADDAKSCQTCGCAYSPKIGDSAFYGGYPVEIKSASCPDEDVTCDCSCGHGCNCK